MVKAIFITVAILEMAFMALVAIAILAFSIASEHMKDLEG